MSENLDRIVSELKAHVLDRYLPGEDPEDLEVSTPLITGGILDSIATVQLSVHLEEKYGVELQAHELSADYIDTLSAIAELVESKQP